MRIWLARPLWAYFEGLLVNVTEGTSIPMAPSRSSEEDAGVAGTQKVWHRRTLVQGRLSLIVFHTCLAVR